MDYAAFRRVRLDPLHLATLSYDVLVSAYNDSDRVKTVFSAVSAPTKIWVVHDEYAYPSSEIPVGGYVSLALEQPIAFWNRLLDHFGIDSGQTLAIDITGMMRPHLLVLPLVLRRRGFNVVVFLYSDPATYTSGGSTGFTKGPVEEVRVLQGLAGTHTVGVDLRDVLVIGAGYDHGLVKAAAEYKRFADHYLMVGLPALQPHMYQESVYRVAKVSDSIRQFRARSRLFAPASDPFMTAQVLSDHVQDLRSRAALDNLYLCPVGPKSQVLGFALFHMYEETSNSTSVLFPFANGYSRETSLGITATHSYEVELA